MEMEIDAPEPQSRPIKDEEFFRAAESGDSSVFQALSPEQLTRALSLTDEDGRSVLHVAVSSAKLDIVNILCESDQLRSVINKKDEEGWAPLHSAASIGNTEIVEILLSNGGEDSTHLLGNSLRGDNGMDLFAGADVNLKNDGGRTALHYAASKGWTKIAEVLISHGAKINMKDKVGGTPLHRAASTGKPEMCELLIEEGAEVDSVDKAGQTPLMTAVICHNKEVALLLIRHGADLDMEDKEGYTVLGRASDELRPLLIDAAKAMLEG